MPDDPQPNPDHVTITKSDLATLQRTYTLFNKLWDDPKHGGTVKRAAKEADPTLRIPEIDVAEPLLAPIRERQEAIEAENKALKDELEKDRQERLDSKAVEDLSKGLKAAQAKYRLTDEAMPEVMRRMREENIASPAAAAALVASEIEPAKVVNGTNFGPADLNVLGMDGKAEDDSTKRLHENPVKWMDREVSEIMQEFDQDAA